MIYVVKEKRLNDFKHVHCIRPRDLFARYGKRELNMTFESSDEPVPIGMNKIDSLEYLERYDREMQNAERMKSAGTGAESHGKHSSKSEEPSKDD